VDGCNFDKSSASAGMGDRGDANLAIFTARRYANAVYAVIVYPSDVFLRLFVRPSVGHKPVLYQNG